MEAAKIMAAISRWSARGLEILLIGACAAIAIGEGLPNPFSQPATVQLGFVSLAVLLLGIVVGFFRETQGASISLSGWVAFVLVTVQHRPRGFVLLLALPGLLFLLSALLRFPGKREVT